MKTIEECIKAEKERISDGIDIAIKIVKKEVEE